MPVLTFDTAAKHFILPSTKDRDAEQQAWVEMPTYPLCTDDYPEYYDAHFIWKEEAKENPGAKEPVLNQYILKRRITKWNFTDATGAPLPITVENIQHLRLLDVAFLMNQIEDEKLEDLTGPKGETSSTTSSPSKTGSM